MARPSAPKIQLVAVDHTFGTGPPPFSEYLLRERLDPAAGAASGADGDSGRRLTHEERAAIEVALAELGPVRWIEDPDEWITRDLTPTVDGAVILGVGEPDIRGDTAFVPVSLWCGGLCGMWLTYRLDLVGDRWEVAGIEGPIAVS